MRLSGMGQLMAEHVLSAMRDPDAGVRRHAVELAERWVDQPAVQNALVAMAADADQLVRYQLAFTLGFLGGNDRLAALAKIARRDSGDHWMRAAIQVSLVKGAGALLEVLAADRDFTMREGSHEVLASLAKQIGRSQSTGDRESLIRAMESSTGRGDDVSHTLVAAALEGARKSAHKEKAVAALLSNEVIAKAHVDLLSHARKSATNTDDSTANRITAIRSLSLASFKVSEGEFRRLLEPRTPHEVQVAALDVLREFNDPAAAELVIQSWPRMTPRLRAQAADLLLARETSIRRLISAIEDGQVSILELDARRLKLMANSRDPAIGERVTRLGVKDSNSITETLRKYESAATVHGSPEKGRTIFRTACAGCHRAENEGHELGPNLATLKNRGAETILLNILDPNREVNPQFINYVVTMTDGRTTSGMIAAETGGNIVLKRAEGSTETIARGEIEEITSTGASIMPEGQEKQIDPQAMADLIAYLMSLK